jgi:hypothetical protein
MKVLLLALVALRALVFGGAAQAQSAGAHEHGVARLAVTVDPTHVTLDLDTPLDNLVGFEHAARTDAERERAAAALARLRAAEGLFRIDPGAGCKLSGAELRAPTLQPGAASAAPAKEGHADLAGHFEFTCKAGARAGFVEVGLFEHFPALRRIDLQVNTPRGQMQATLLRPASRVALAR